MPEKLADFLDRIDWGAINEVNVTQDGKYYSFSVEIEREKRIVTIGVAPKHTTLTVSDVQGNILAHAVQQGQQITFFTEKQGS